MYIYLQNAWYGKKDKIWLYNYETTFLTQMVKKCFIQKV